MDNFNEIKKIWLSANATALPKAANILQTIKKYRLKQILKTGGLVVLTLFLILTMCWVLFAYHSQLISTRIGEACIFFAMFILLSVNVRSLKRVSKSKTFSNSEFLTFLKQEQLRLIRYQKKTQVIGFLLASVGLLFYLYEGVHTRFSVMIISYVGLIIWCCICWFIIHPKAMERKTKKLNETIVKLEQFLEQLQNESC